MLFVKRQSTHMHSECHVIHTIYFGPDFGLLACNVVVKKRKWGRQGLCPSDEIFNKMHSLSVQ